MTTIKCKNISNRGNGDNCKISQKNPQTSLSQSCTFSREYSKLNGDIKGKRTSQSVKLCKNLGDCYAKESSHDYWKTVIAPQVQEKLYSLDKQIETKENKKKEKVRV